MVAPESGAAMDFAFTVDPDITRARTLPSQFYLDPAVHAATRERVFARTWQWLGDLGDVAAPGSLSPRELLPGHLDEPLLLSRDGGGTLRCLSNVCTHRGNLLVRAPCRAESIRCGYHSRRFDLAGRMTFMPGFEQARDFPSASDHLPRVPLGDLAGHAFAALAPAAPFDAFLGDVADRRVLLVGLSQPDAQRLSLGAVAEPRAAAGARPHPRRLSRLRTRPGAARRRRRRRPRPGRARGRGRRRVGAARPALPPLPRRPLLAHARARRAPLPPPALRAHGPALSPLRIALAGLVTLAVAMGIGRFAFTPIMPMMLHDGVVDLQHASWLASTNYLGYLVGAVLCTFDPWLRRRLGLRRPADGPAIVRNGLAATAL